MQEHFEHVDLFWVDEGDRRENKINMRFRICICNFFRSLFRICFCVCCESMLQWKNKKNNENVTGVFGSLNFRCIRNSRAAQFVCVGVLFLLYFIFVHFQEWIIFGGSCSGSADIDVCLVSACLFLFAPPIKCNVCMSVFFPGFIFGVYRLSCRPSSIAPNKWFRLQVKCI